MKIKAITIENFKSISEPVRIEFKPLTLLFGPNSAGKSTIIQALHYIREVLEFRRLDVDKTISGGDFIDLGGFDNFVHGHDLSKKVSFRIELHSVNKSFSLAEEAIRDSSKLDEFLTESNIWLSFSIMKEANSVVVSDYAICFNDILYVASEKNAETINLLLDRKKVLRNIQEILEFSDDCFCEDAGYHWYEDVDKHFYWHNTKSIDNFLPEYGATDADVYDRIEGKVLGYSKSRILGTIVDELKGLLYLGPLRTIPPRNYSPQKTFAPSRWSDGLAAWDVASYSNQETIDEINKWLGKKHPDTNLEIGLDTGYALKRKAAVTLEQGELQLMENPGSLSKEDLVALVARLHDGKVPKVALTQGKDGLEVSLCDVGVGISQTFPVVMAALDKDAKMVIIEQPELHIHPRLQVELGDLFISAAKQDKCMIIETHSEHLILRLMRRMRQTVDDELPEGMAKVTPDDVTILYVQPTATGSVVRTLELDAEGQLLDPWPGGFFEEGFNERFA